MPGEDSELEQESEAESVEHSEVEPTRRRKRKEREPPWLQPLLVKSMKLAREEALATTRLTPATNTGMELGKA